MGTVRRMSRSRRVGREPLTIAWQSGDEPPAWAFEPGEHHDEIIGLFFFSDRPELRDSHTHPHRAEWFAALRSSSQDKLGIYGHFAEPPAITLIDTNAELGRIYASQFDVIEDL